MTPDERVIGAIDIFANALADAMEDAVAKSEPRIAALRDSACAEDEATWAGEVVAQTTTLLWRDAVRTIQSTITKQIEATAAALEKEGA